MNQKDALEFGTLRSYLWPIHRHELRMFLPMLIMIFFVCFNYSILRSMKDSVLITAPGGAEVLPFIKLWVILPAAILSTLIFTKLSNHYSQEKVFYMVISFFISGYLLFAFVLYPMREFLHPESLAVSMTEILPKGFKGLISMLCYWTYTGFYVLCELWSTLVLSVLFWGFANEVTKITVARRFYSVFSIFSNISAIIAGQTANFLSTRGIYNENLPFGSDSYEQTMMTMVVVICSTSLIIMGVFRWMNKNVLNHASFDEFHKTKRELKAKGKLSIRDSFTYLSNSKYLICIAVIVVGYNLSINLAEILWKDRLRTLYDKADDVNVFLNNLTSTMGVISTIIAIFMARIIARFGWTKTAGITPVIMLIISIGFFGFIIFEKELAPYAISFFGMSSLALSVYFGALQNCLSKAMKYSVFDATKEIAFIPLDHESKLKGKAAIDGVGSRIGKSGGSLLYQGLILSFGSILSSAPPVALIIIGSIGGWIYAVRTLGKQFTEKVRMQAGDLVAPEAPVSTTQSAPVSNTL